MPFTLWCMNKNEMYLVCVSAIVAKISHMCTNAHTSNLFDRDHISTIAIC